MKSIEIKTTQNVVLQYELADLKDRIIAYLIDMVCITVAISLLSVIGFSILGLYGTSAQVYVIFLFCVFIFYSLAFEVLNNGQSLGKMAMRIRVIRTVGGKASFADYSARWAFRMVDIYFSLGGLASVLIASSTKAQRIGDIVANTAVVKLNQSFDLALKDLLAIRTQDTYQPQYLQAKQLQERDVLVIKTALERFLRFKNDAHQEALNLLADKIRETLQIQDDATDNRRFLQTILSDYVVLTR